MIEEVLIEPEIPANTGNIIRTCSCTGSNLHLVRPLGFTMEEKHLRRAGLDYRDIANINYYDSFEEVEEKFKELSFYLFTTKGKKYFDEVKYTSHAVLVFGKETRGISQEILERRKDDLIRIPMLDREGVRCLNLSNSVAVAVYETLKQQHYPNFH